LFRKTDEGQAKADCAARSARQIYDEMRVTPMVGNVLADVGLGWFHWAQVVIGALDNREARVFVNAACARVGRPWLDGGIEVLQDLGLDTPIKTIWDRGVDLLGNLDAVDLGRELVEQMECGKCGRREAVHQPAEKLRDDQLLCPACGQECSPTFFHSISAT